MNFGTLKSRVLLNAGNIGSAHPIGANVGQYVNDGTRLMILRAGAKFPNFQLFPEHKDVEWDDVTIADQAYLTLPTDQIVPQRAFSLDSATAPNFNNASWRLLQWLELEAYDQLTKSTANVAYPTNWTAREGKIFFYPTPRATKTTYVKVDGLEDEPDMVNATDTPRTHMRWHPAIIDMASHLICVDLGWTEDAQRFLTSCDDKIATVGGAMVNLRRADLNKPITIKGMPKVS